jgi:hypothetical protein
MCFWSPVTAFKKTLFVNYTQMKFHARDLIVQFHEKFTSHCLNFEAISLVHRYFVTEKKKKVFYCGIVYCSVRKKVYSFQQIRSAWFAEKLSYFWYVDRSVLLRSSAKLRNTVDSVHTHARTHAHTHTHTHTRTHTISLSIIFNPYAPTNIIALNAGCIIQNSP